MAHLFTPDYIAKVVDFGLFVAFIVWMYGKYIKPALVAHQEAQNRAVEEGRAKRAQMAAAVEAARTAVEKAKRDASTMFSVAQQQAKSLIASERAREQERAQRIVAYAHGELARERYRVRHELLADTVERAYGQAREAIKRQLDDAGQRRLIEAFIRDLEARTRV